MLGKVRTFMEGWVARICFALVMLMFVFWGISNVFTLPSGATAVAYVAGKPVNVSLVQAAYQRLLRQVQQQGQQPDTAQRQQIAAQALSSVLREQVLAQSARQNGLGVPDEAVRKILYGIPVFQVNGAFSKDRFAEILQQNGLSQDEFINEIKSDLIARQLITPLVNGAAVPDDMTNKIFALLSEQRLADTVRISVADQPIPPTPSDAVLHRFWLNHQSLFTAPEYRTVQVVILSPALMAPHEVVPQAKLDAGVQQAVATSTIPQTRSAEILSVEDLADASQLQAAWQRGASWSHMQRLAKHYHAQPIPLDNAQKDQIPASALASAIFAAEPGKIIGPIAGSQSMYIFRVTGIYPDHAQYVAQVKQQLQMQMAQDQVAKNIDALQDALAGQTPLTQLPGNLGLVAIEGTLDAGGLTPAGTPAPIPGDDNLRNAIVKAVFATTKGQSTRLQTGPDGSYYAINIQTITPPTVRPFETAQTRVLSAWQHDEQERAANALTATLMHEVNSGTSLVAAAAKARLNVAHTSGYTRNEQPQDQPSGFVTALFSLKHGQATMLSSQDSFMVVALADIRHPTPQANPETYAALKQNLDKSLQADLADSFLQGLQAQEKVQINQKLFTQIYQ